MKLFIREYLSLIVLQVIQLITLVGLFALSGFTDWPILAYSLFLCNIFLFGYLCYQYVSHRKFYQILTKQLHVLDDSLQPLDPRPISTALGHLLKNQYELYQEKIISLDEKQKEQLIFIDRWVHQMKTPLSVIELLAQELDEPEASSLREEADRLKTGLTTALYMARLRNIEQDFNIKRVRVNTLIQDVLDENKRLFIRHGVYPKVHVPENIFVYSDEKWLMFMVNQLVENAIKYSSGHTDKLLIMIDETDGKISLAITDEGIGIPQEDIRRIFQPFYTGKNGRLYRESTGVGLYLVKEVATYLGHDIKVSSTVNKGTTFEIVFSKW